MNEPDPISLFKKWYHEELQNNDAQIPSACCLSTTGLDGYPNARFLSLKDIINNSFIITGSLKSRKATEINASNKTALSFWWAASGRQVRIQGDAYQIEDEIADKYFQERSKESQVISLISKQGMVIEDVRMLNEKYQAALRELTGHEISRPKDWGGYAIKPLRIEFLKFNVSRYHERMLYEREDELWNVRFLQP